MSQTILNPLRRRFGEHSRRLKLAFAFAPTAHFLISFLLWSVEWSTEASFLRGYGFTRTDVFWLIFPFTWPCISLLALSSLSIVLAWRRSSRATALIVLTLVLSLTACAYDVKNGRYQLVIDRGFYPGGEHHVYYTWWLHGI